MKISKLILLKEYLFSITSKPSKLEKKIMYLRHSKIKCTVDISNLRSHLLSSIICKESTFDLDYIGNT